MVLLVSTNATDHHHLLLLLLKQYGEGYGATLRVHIGLEHVDDLIQDLHTAFAAMHAANTRSL
jgi:cystathionine beta-lyase/cystathionine gamma-synthase